MTETARGIALAANSDALIGRVVNIAYGEMVTVRQLAEAIAHLCGRTDIAPRFIEPRPGDVRALRAETRLARDTLAFVAKIDLDQGLRRYIDWFRANYPDPSDLLENKIRNWRFPRNCDEPLSAGS